MMSDKFFKILYPKFENIMVISLALALMVTLIYAAIIFFMALLVAIVNVDILSIFNSIMAHDTTAAEVITQLQNGLFNIFGGFLLILLGIELIGTVRIFSQENQIKIESILAISIIATSRHLITLDYHTTAPGIVFGAGFVTLALVVGYFLLKIKVKTLDGKNISKVNIE